MKQPKIDVLVPSFDPPEQWRSERQKKELDSEGWKALRQKILQRDGQACRYCGYTAQSFMNVDHIDGDPRNNAEQNLQTLCMWCHMLKHAGLHSVIRGSLELYQKPEELDQVTAIIKIRELRGERLSDDEIKKRLGLVKRMPFNMDHAYLSGLIGFINSKPINENGRWKIYGNITVRYSDGTYPSVFINQ
ncbi:MAG: HNH endonuclease [Candidatus Micrarchaeales archaeon]